MCVPELSSGWQAWSVVAIGLCGVLLIATGFMVWVSQRYQRADQHRETLRRAQQWRPPEAREEVEE